MCIGASQSSLLIIPIYMGEQLINDSANTIIDYDQSIKSGTFNWDGF